MCSMFKCESSLSDLLHGNKYICTDPGPVMQTADKISSTIVLFVSLDA